MNAIEHFLDDVATLRQAGWHLADINASSAREIEVLAHVARLPELVDLTAGSRQGEMFALAARQLEAGRRMAPTLSTYAPSTSTAPVPPSSPNRSQPPSGGRLRTIGELVSFVGWWIRTAAGC
jgi:hypothetical protein